MEKLSPSNKLCYSLKGVQLFSKSSLADLMGINRNSVAKNIKNWEVKPTARNNKGQELYSVKSYVDGSSDSMLSKEGDERFGGYADALEHKTVIETARLEIKLNNELGDYISVADAESAIASCFADNAKMADELLTIVETELQPKGDQMERISNKFKSTQNNYFQQIEDLSCAP